jgi:hypothetical protein
MNKQRRRLLAAEQAEPRPVALVVHFADRDLGPAVLDQAVTRRRPERITHAGIDAEIVRRLRENRGGGGGAQLMLRGWCTVHAPGGEGGGAS